MCYREEESTTNSAYGMCVVMLVCAKKMLSVDLIQDQGVNIVSISVVLYIITGHCLLGFRGEKKKYCSHDFCCSCREKEWKKLSIIIKVTVQLKPTGGKSSLKNTCLMPRYASLSISNGVGFIRCSEWFPNLRICVTMSLIPNIDDKLKSKIYLSDAKVYAPNQVETMFS